MTNAEKEFAEAYDKVLDAQMEALLKQAEEEDHKFSPRFERRMAKLLRSVEKGRPVNRRGRRVLIAALAAVLLLAGTACAVPQIRSSVVGFFVKTFGDHVQYTDLEVTKETIEEVYGLVPVPEGLQLIDSTGNDVIKITTYKDGNGIEMILIQSVDKNLLHLIDNQQGTISESSINGNSVSIYYSNDSAQASWTENGYYFSFSYPSHIEPEKLEQFIGAVNVKTE